MSELLYMVRIAPSEGKWRVLPVPYDFDLEHKPLVFKTRRQAEAVRKAKEVAQAKNINRRT